MSADDKLRVAAAQSGNVAAARAALDSGANNERKHEVRCGWMATQRTLPAPPCARIHAPRATRCAQNGMTPLSWAARSGHLGVVQLLVERGADIGTTDNVRCPSHQIGHTVSSAHALCQPAAAARHSARNRCCDAMLR